MHKTKMYISDNIHVKNFGCLKLAQYCSLKGCVSVIPDVTDINLQDYLLDIFSVISTKRHFTGMGTAQWLEDLTADQVKMTPCTLLCI